MAHALISGPYENEESSKEENENNEVSGSENEKESGDDIENEESVGEESENEESDGEESKNGKAGGDNVENEESDGDDIDFIKEYLTEQNDDIDVVNIDSTTDKSDSHTSSESEDTFHDNVVIAKRPPFYEPKL